VTGADARGRGPRNACATGPWCGYPGLVVDQPAGRWRRALTRLTSSTEELEAVELHEQSTERGCVAIADIVPRARCTVSGTLRTVTFRPRAGVPALVADLYDGTGVLRLVWIGRRRIPGITPGRAMIVTGRAAAEDDELVIFNPHYTLLPAGVDR